MSIISITVKNMRQSLISYFTSNVGLVIYIEYNERIFKKLEYNETGIINKEIKYYDNYKHEPKSKV